MNDKVFTGADCKILQYVEYKKEICEDVIDIVDILGHTLFNKSVSSNFIMINLEKDRERYDSAIEEFKKLTISNFVHLKGTYWKDKRVLEKDLMFVKRFLKQFIPTTNTMP